MALFGSKKPTIPTRPTPVDWGRNPRGQFYKFLSFEPEKAGLKGVGGVYVLWHSGVQPRWVYVGQSTDIAADLDALADNDEVMEYNSRGGLFVTWLGKRHKDAFIRATAIIYASCAVLGGCVA